MEDIQTKQKFFTRQELGTVIFSVVLTVFMVAMMAFGILYKTGDTGSNSPEQMTISETQG